MFQKVSKVVAGVVTSGLVFAGTALADTSEGIDLSGVEMDMSSVGTLGALALTGLGVMWGLRKAIKTINRS